MPHLICASHQKRVLVLYYVVVHREDGAQCWSEYLSHARHGRTTAALIRAAERLKDEASTRAGP